MTLFAGIALGITVFGETLAHGNGRLLPAAGGLLLALFGVGLLVGPHPRTRSRSQFEGPPSRTLPMSGSRRSIMLSVDLPPIDS